MEDIMEGLIGFARDEVLETLAERSRYRSFSHALLRKMGELGLLGITLSSEYGGVGGDPRDLADAMIVFAREGMDLGLALSWVVHLSICCKSIEAFGNSSQKNKFLPKLISGEMVGAMAVSEPETGAHPGRMKTRAELKGDYYLIQGSKVFITNAPVADVTIVLAVTGSSDDEQEITAFLVEGRKVGIDITPLETGFVETSPHGEIQLSSVKVKKEAVLGEVGEGHDPMSKLAFRRERALALCALVGTCEAAARLVHERFMKMDAVESLSAAEMATWIHHMAALSPFELTAKEVVSMAFGEEEIGPEAIDPMIYLGLSLRKWASWIETLVEAKEVSKEFPLDVILRDLQLAKVGSGLLMKLGKRRFLDTLGSGGEEEM